jgi:hypothetical protein
MSAPLLSYELFSSSYVGHPEQRHCHASQLFSTGKFGIFHFDFCETKLQNSECDNEEALKTSCSPLGERAERLRTGSYAAASQAGAGGF